LVRGLDYYTRTVFEVIPPEEGAQSTIGGGGRYDGLIELLGGRPTPGVGFATGIERIILNLKSQGMPVAHERHPEVYVAVQSPPARVDAFRLASELRRSGIPTIVGAGGRSLKAQLGHADKIGARYAAIIGAREMADRSVTLRHLANGTQETIPTAEVVERISPSSAT
jgi:histidyl-tRNA synthetase